MDRSNPRVQLAVRNAVCADCKMCGQATDKDVCVTAEGAHDARVLVVSKTPLGSRGKKEIHTYLTRAGFDPEKIAFTGAVKCLTWDMQPSKTDIKACRKYLQAEIDFIKPDWVLCLGNEALTSATGHSGIMKWRGKVVHQRTPRGHEYDVLGTISPAMVYRNPGQKNEFEADLKFFHNLVLGKTESGLLPSGDQYRVVDSKAAVKELISYLDIAEVASFDLETSSFDEFAPDARIISMAITLYVTDTSSLVGQPEPFKLCFAVPLWHRESPWRTRWRQLLEIIGRHLKRVPKVVAHNGKFDCRWLRQFGVNVKVTFDTMLAAHLLNENRPKGLKPLARTELGVPPWDIEIKNEKGKPWFETHSLKDILWYNALDTWHAFGLYLVFREQLKKQPRLARIFTRILMPASEEYTEIERHGVWVDREKLHTNWQISQDERDSIDEQLTQHVPEDHGFEKINFRPSNFLRWWLFEHLKLPVLARGKNKDDGEPGNPSTAEAVMTRLVDHHSVVPLLLERSKWEKYCSAFFSAYSEQIDENDRIHTTFKITGTVTGRTSSGKADVEKVTGVKQIRGVNLQQVPRDEFVRGIFGAPPGYSFVEADYSQIELRVAAFLAQERNMLHLYATGQDIHMATAMRMTGKPARLVTKEERKKAKAVNFGFLYGMSWAKFIETAWNNYGLVVTEAEAKAFRKAFFEQFPGLLPWHAKQRRLAAKYGRVVSPIGRVRHLPDIESADREVRAEAERQAINSPVQGFASDMALLAMILINKEFRARELEATAIGTVHDAVNFEIPDHELAEALPIVKHVMENLPLREWFGVDLNVPIVADLKVGDRWGGAKELTSEQVLNFPGKELIGVG